MVRKRNNNYLIERREMAILINQLLFFAMAVFCLMDYFQTVALIELGYTELNPIVMFIVNDGANWNNLLILKIVLLTMCETFLITNYYQKRRKVK